jgi:hypothetical protein
MGKIFGSDASDDADEKPAPRIVSSVLPGTVLKSFNGSNRRFPKDYVVVDADAADLPLPLDDLKSRGFVG